MEIGASGLSPYTLIAANARVIGPRIQSRFFSSAQILEPHHLARGKSVPPYGKYRIAHSRMVVALCRIGHCHVVQPRTPHPSTH
jgi:hypothetical protein